MISLILLSLPLRAEERVDGFRKHQEINKKHDHLRNLGFEEWLAQSKSWEKKRAKWAKEFSSKTDPKKDEIQEDYFKFKRQEEQHKEEQSENQNKYRKQAEIIEKKNQIENSQLYHAGEMELDTRRPRYKLSERALYGATPKYKSSPSKVGGGFDGSSDSSPSDYGGMQPVPRGGDDGMGDEFSDLNNVSPPSIPYDQQMENNFPPPYFSDDEVPPPPPMDFDDSF